METGWLFRHLRKVVSNIFLINCSQDGVMLFPQIKKKKTKASYITEFVEEDDFPLWS